MDPRRMHRHVGHLKLATRLIGQAVRTRHPASRPTKGHLSSGLVAPKANSNTRPERSPGSLIAERENRPRSDKAGYYAGIQRHCAQDDQNSH